MGLANTALVVSQRPHSAYLAVIVQHLVSKQHVIQVITALQAPLSKTHAQLARIVPPPLLHWLVVHQANTALSDQQAVQRVQLDPSARLLVLSPLVLLANLA